MSQKTAYEILRKLKFMSKSHYSLTEEERQKECKRLKIQLKSLEKLSENKKLLANINQFMKEDEKLMLFSTVLKEESTSFMSYMGAKRSLLLELIARLPEKFNNYYEPFIGGGSLFFALNMLMNAGIEFDKFDEEIERQMYIADYNSRLIELYRLIKDDSDALFEDLNRYQEEYNSLESTEERKVYFNKAMKDYNGNMGNVSLLLFIVNTCHNSAFNFKNGKIQAGYAKEKLFKFNEENILRCSQILKQSNVHVANQSYEDILNNVQSEDFVYLDPPYYSCKKQCIDYGSGFNRF